MIVMVVIILHSSHPTYSLVCDPPAPSGDIQCAIVGSSVLIMAEKITEEERIELRTKVMTALSEAINNGSFEKHLP